MSRLFESLATTALGMFLVIAPAIADEKKVSLDQVPKPVLEAVKAKFAGAQLTAAEINKEDGKTIYEIALQHEGKRYEAEFRPDGKLIGYDKVISINDLPQAVSAALQAKYPGAAYREIEEVHKINAGKDKLDCYEVHVLQGKKKYEVVFSPAGKITKEEDESKPKDD